MKGEKISSLVSHFVRFPTLNYASVMLSRALGIPISQYVAFYRTFCLSTNPPHKADDGLITTPVPNNSLKIPTLAIPVKL